MSGCSPRRSDKVTACLANRWKGLWVLRKRSFPPSFFFLVSSFSVIPESLSAVPCPSRIKTVDRSPIQDSPISTHDRTSQGTKIDRRTPDATISQESMIVQDATMIIRTEGTIDRGPERGAIGLNTDEITDTSINSVLISHDKPILAMLCSWPLPSTRKSLLRT